ncbi:hypothetical protein FMN63_02195 [Stappia sp. BW2]|uniref:hypothetical protein n=1 Tax=Stappia sp. BW2 TaxID=2592622 RepID=UPI0011DEDD95|nr:hypothetical protein [Stappia sp. BW2]TYC80073.1 hypothetical protein FMN63_02195 [Stappia sp. BW2]
MSLRKLLLLIVVTYTGYHIYDTLQGFAVYKFDQSCLKYKRSEVDLPSIHAFASHNIAPKLFVPAPLPYWRNNGPSDEGIIVQYKKGDIRHREDRLKRDSRTLEGCMTKLAEHGLVELIFEKGSRCSLHSYSKKFESIDTHEPDGAVEIYCSNEPRSLTCRAQDQMPNGWFAYSEFSKESLKDWRIATAAAREFFDSKMIDCTPK